jgi:hypothetical protein
MFSTGPSHFSTRWISRPSIRKRVTSRSRTASKANSTPGFNRLPMMRAATALSFSTTRHRAGPPGAGGVAPLIPVRKTPAMSALGMNDGFMG